MKSVIKSALKPHLTLLLVLGGGLIVSPSFANQQIRDAQNWAYHNCGSPNPAHCVGSGSSSGGGYYREPKPKPTYFWVAVTDNSSPQSTNMPMFFSLKARFGAETTAERHLDYLTLYALDQCNKHYGTGNCQLRESSFGVKNSYVATASTAKKGATKGFVATTRWAHNSKA